MAQDQDLGILGAVGFTRTGPRSAGRKPRLRLLAGVRGIPPSSSASSHRHRGSGSAAACAGSSVAVAAGWPRRRRFAGAALHEALSRNATGGGEQGPALIQGAGLLTVAAGLLRDHMLLNAPGEQGRVVA